MDQLIWPSALLSPRSPFLLDQGVQSSVLTCCDITPIVFVFRLSSLIGPEYRLKHEKSCEYTDMGLTLLA